MRLRIPHSVFVLRACALAVALAAAPHAHAQPTEAPEFKLDPIAFRGPAPEKRFQDIEIEQRLNAQVPLDLEFRDENGKTVKLRDYFDGKPIVLSLVYYECPMLCNLILNGVVAGLDGTENTLNLDTDYRAITVSIDPGETPELAAAKKATYLKEYRRPGGEDGWHFLTGSQEAIEALASAVGYRYFYDEVTDEFAHASGIMFLTPDGRISSYYLGIEYLPRLVQVALMKAAEGGIGTLAQKLVLLCYAYDPTTGSYGFYIINAARLGGMATVLALVLFWAINYARNASKRAAIGVGNQHGEALG